MLNLTLNEPYKEPCALVLGGFDGLHIGHRVLLQGAASAGLPVVLTAMTGGKGKSLFTLPEREFLFERAGVSALLELPFTERLRMTPPEMFLQELFSALNVRVVFCGEDFRFGKDASGTPDLLKQFVPCVRVLGLVERDGRKISASACKNCLQAGDLIGLNALLLPKDADFYGCAYFVQGRVEHGREVGRTYGFPTANLAVPPEKLLPPDGVYGGMCTVPAGNYPCIVNIGARPTFGVEERKIEAYLDGFSGNLYGETVRIYPTEFLRGIETFPSAEALRAQLAEDIVNLRENKR